MDIMTTGDCTPREIEENELEKLLALYAQLHGEAPPERTPELLALWTGILRDKNYHIIVCAKGKELVSSCTLVVVPNLTRGGRPYGLIENVVTDERFRGRGLATSCLEYARDTAKAAGCYKLMLLTGARIESTLRFYERAGFNRNDKTAFIQWLQNGEAE